MLVNNVHGHPDFTSTHELQAVNIYTTVHTDRNPQKVVCSITVRDGDIHETPHEKKAGVTSFQAI